MDLQGYDCPAYQLTVLCNVPMTRYLERQIRRLTYGDALVRRGYRLEYISPIKGFTHYRLYQSRKLVGIQYVRDPRWLPYVQRNLAAYLALMGFNRQNTSLQVGGAKTSLRAKTNRLPKLFVLEFNDFEDQVIESLVDAPKPAIVLKTVQMASPN